VKPALPNDPPIEPKDYIKRPRRPQPSSARWIIKIVGWAFVISMILSLVSGSLIPRMNIIFALLILLSFIALGVFFDILGLSVATASSKPFHSMAARRVKGAAQSLRLLKNPERITSFCADVVGDIAGIISGATASVIVTRLAEDQSVSNIVLQVFLSAVVSTLTIGGKAFGKTISLRHNTVIVTHMGRAMYRFEALRKRMLPKSRRGSL
jgi:CBS domain containing-hemolysin-like protein